MRSTWKKVLSLCLALLVWSPLALAIPQGGETELQFGADFFMQDNSDTGAATGEVEWGKYTDDAMFEWGVRQSLNYTFVDDSDDSWLAVTSPFINYNFMIDDCNWVPYVGAFVGLVWNDDDTQGTTGPQAGVRAFVSDQTFINFAYRYEWFFDDFDVIEEESSNGNHVGTIGVGFIF